MAWQSCMGPGVICGHLEDNSSIDSPIGKRTIAGKEYIGPPKERWIARKAMNDPKVQGLEKRIAEKSNRSEYFQP